MSFKAKSHILLRDDNEREFMNFNLIGAGRLGQNIALNLVSTGLGQLACICNQSLASANQAQKIIGQGQGMAQIKELPPADITWITAKDDAIPSIVHELAQNPHLKANSFIIHCSGALNSKSLAPLKAKGCAIASFHPLKAFKSGNVYNGIFEKVDCVIEGDDAVCTWLQQSFTQLGAQISTIEPESKALYHAAAVIASNYLVTLAACSEQLLLKAGINSTHAHAMLGHLMQGSLDNVQQSPHIADALTGPLVRGDNKTISLHLAALEDESIIKLYKAAGLASLPLTQLDDAQQLVFKELFK